ncbi:odorant receptor 30a-like [Cylas formicarius]|uniref:odorant receptor 30a-like n=1 Tax=Cylas formicarius TaxID=197179 RepID=UPI002958DD9A|nr:odorant receptor 30a-like [Cylas formicarius]
MSVENGLFERAKFIMMLGGIWKLKNNNCGTCATMDTISKAIFSSIVVLKARMCQTTTIVHLISAVLKEEQRIYCNKMSQELKIYTKHAGFCNKLAFFLVISISTAGGYVLVLGYVQIFKYYASSQLANHGNVTIEKPTILNFWYPFNLHEYYIWTVVDETLASVYAMIWSAAVNIFINSIMIFLRAQLITLQHNFIHFHQGSNLRETPFESLKTLSVRHQHIIQYVERFNESLKYVLLLEFTIASVMLATALFQTFAGRDVAFNCAFIIMSSSQIIILAWNSDEILTQSLKLADALYESSWYEQIRETKILIHTMLLRCQKPLTLSIGPLGPLTVDVAASRFKLAYTYASVITGTFSE